MSPWGLCLYFGVIRGVVLLLSRSYFVLTVTIDDDWNKFAALSIVELYCGITSNH